MPADRASSPLQKSLTEAIGQTAGVLASSIAEAITRGTEVASHGAGSLASKSLRHAGAVPSLPKWVDSILAQYRDSLGGLALVLPQIAHRLDRDLRASATDRLLFRARAAREGLKRSGIETTLHEFYDAIEDMKTADGDYALALFSAATVELVEGRANDLGTRAGDLPGLLETLARVFQDERRKSLPSVLDELKEAVRENRRAGIALVHERLSWLLAFDGEVLARAFDLHDTLSDELGERCLDVLIHAIPILYDENTRPRNPFLPGQLRSTRQGTGTEEPVDWELLVRKCFEAIGHPLEGAVSILRTGGSDLSTEITILDHVQDLVFHLRRGTRVASKPNRSASYDLELYGPFAGKRYLLTLGSGDVEANAKKLLRLPARISSARGGMAMWTIDRRLVQEQLDALNANVPMAAWDIGANLALVSLFIMHYRESDLGSYYEMGLGCIAAPASNPQAVGFVPIGTMPVSSTESEIAGSQIWGYPKKTIPLNDWTVRHPMGEAHWSVKLDSRGTTLRVVLPRGGTGMSETVPVPTYALKEGQWYESVLMRSGQGESFRLGGRGASVLVSGKDWDSPNNGLPAMLYTLGILRKANGSDGASVGVMARTPSYTAWTEHMSGELLPPWVVPSLPVFEDR